MDLPSLLYHVNRFPWGGISMTSIQFAKSWNYSISAILKLSGLPLLSSLLITTLKSLPRHHKSTTNTLFDIVRSFHIYLFSDKEHVEYIFATIHDLPTIFQSKNVHKNPPPWKWNLIVKRSLPQIFKSPPKRPWDEDAINLNFESPPYHKSLTKEMSTESSLVSCKKT